MGNKDVTIDIGAIPQESVLVLAELKNRIDSGGSAARREVLTSQKFGAIIDYLIAGDKIFKKGTQAFSLSQLLEYFNIRMLELYLGILFDKSDNPATLEADKREGFYSSSREGFEFLINQLESKEILVSNAKKALENLKLSFVIPQTTLKIKIEAVYGDDIPRKLFRKSFAISNLLLLKYDDIWLSQLTTINERACLLKFGENLTTLLLNLLKKDEDLTEMLNELLSHEYELPLLQKLCNKIISEYPVLIRPEFIPAGRDKEEYLGDIVQLIGAWNIILGKHKV